MPSPPGLSVKINNEADVKQVGNETDFALGETSSRKVDREGDDFPNSWTRRLFDSEYLYEPRLAVLYLYRYPKAFGLQYYLCEKLESLSFEELTFYLPQLSHLLLNRKTECWALEKFLLGKCKKDNHTAIALTWLIRAHLGDVTASGNLEAANSCRQLYCRFRSLLFNDTSDPERTLELQASVLPALVGIGSVLASVLCTPLAKIMSKMVLGQTFVAPTLDDFSVDGQIQDNSYKKNPKPTTVANVKNTYTMTKSASASVIPLPRTKVKGLPSAMSSDTANIIKRLTHDGTCEQGIDVMDPFTPEELSNGTAFSFLKFLDRHNIPVKPDIMPINKRYNNLVVRDDILSPLKGSELFPSTLKNVSQVAKNSFYYNEFRFMSTLADISERLIAVPHESRQNILLGELSLLNYNLPANICIPFYCRKESVGKACDHSVMQIVLSESVVLNSSERAPYLLTLEVADNNPGNIQKLRYPDNELMGAAIAPVSRECFNANVNGTTTSEHSERAVDIDANNNAYHENVMNRRKSTFESLKLSSRDNTRSLDDAASDAESHSSFLQLADTYSERMRTTAIMLSQLYKSRFPEKHSAADQNIQNSEKAAPRPTTLGYAKSFVSLLSQKAHLTSRSPHDPSGAQSPQKITKDKQLPKSMKANFDSVRDRLLNEMATLEQQRVEALERANSSYREAHSGIIVDNISEFPDASAPPAGTDDSIPKPNSAAASDHNEAISVLNEKWADKEERLRVSSPYGHLSGWKLVSFIVKSGADMKQELLAMQIVEELKKTFMEERVPVWIKSFGIMVISNRAGLVETIRNSISVDSIKKHGYRNKFCKDGIPYTLYDYFVKRFGPYGSPGFLRAQDAFMRSLAAYSLMCYLFQVKDRHNGNILVDNEGHIVHIDYGFMLSNSPGSLGFEMAPFKLSQEYIDILGGPQSEVFYEFRSLMKDAFAALRKHSERVITLVEIMERGSHMACFSNSQGKSQLKPEFDIEDTNNSTQGHLTPVTNSLRGRFNLYMGTDECSVFIDKLIDSSYNSYYTRIYDMFQYYNNGYF